MELWDWSWVVAQSSEAVSVSGLTSRRKRRESDMRQLLNALWLFSATASAFFWPPYHTPDLGASDYLDLHILNCLYSTIKFKALLVEFSFRNTRGGPIRRFQKPYLCSLLWQIMLLYLIWKLWMSPFIWCMVAWSASRGCRVTDHNVRVCC